MSTIGVSGTLLTTNQELVIYDLAQAVHAEHANGYNLMDVAMLWVSADTIAGRYSEAEVEELVEMELIEINRGMSGQAIDIRLTEEGADLYDFVISKNW